MIHEWKLSLLHPANRGGSEVAGRGLNVRDIAPSLQLRSQEKEYRAKRPHGIFSIDFIDGRAAEVTAYSLMKNCA